MMAIPVPAGRGSQKGTKTARSAGAFPSVAVCRGLTGPFRSAMRPFHQISHPHGLGGGSLAHPDQEQ